MLRRAQQAPVSCKGVRTAAAQHQGLFSQFNQKQPTGGAFNIVFPMFRNPPLSHPVPSLVPCNLMPLFPAAPFCPCSLQLVSLFQSYFEGELKEKSIKNNFVLMYELLDEAMDFGFPQITESTVLKSLIFQKGFRSELPLFEVRAGGQAGVGVRVGQAGVGVRVGQAGVGVRVGQAGK